MTVGPAKQTIPVTEAKRIVLESLRAGEQVAAAMKRVGRSYETYRDWRKADKEFAEATLIARNLSKQIRREFEEVPPFDEFCGKFLGQPLPEHQKRALDVIEGRYPRSFEPTMVFQQGAEPGRYTILNFPPNHAKSTCWSVNYVVWRILKDPSIRIVVLSKTRQLALKFLAAVKFILTSERYGKLHAAFTPDGGWKDPDLPWREDQFYVRGRATAEKDPTCQALGIGSQIYGTRSDLIIADDVEDLNNVGMYLKHADWISREVLSRLEPGHEDTHEGEGELLILGTRVSAMDLYRYLRDEAKTMEGLPFYTYFSQPAILENAQSSHEQWRVLWPERMHARAIAAQKGAYPDRRKFELIYQQSDISDESTFPVDAVHAAIDTRRLPGVLTDHVRPNGMSGCYVIAGLDPATVGATAIVVIAVDKRTKHRWVMNAFNERNCSPERMLNMIYDWTVRYRVNEWRIERNAFQKFLTQLPQLKEFLVNRGVLLKEHTTTGKLKWDETFGVETLAPLFTSCIEIRDEHRVAKPAGQGMISFPLTKKHNALSALVEQLTVWEPNMAKGTATDLVMALWFAELGVRQYLQGANFTQTHLKSRFQTRHHLANQMTISIDELYDQGLINAL